MTVEDPIEYLHRDKLSIINQREIGVDTNSFSQALRSALRQDPDVILVGEMRDFETIETALLAAETGHLVFSTLHTLDATETINRIIAVFPPHQQKQIRIQLASVLKAVISQRLIPQGGRQGPRAGGRGDDQHRVHPRRIVDKDKTHLIHGAIAQGTSQYGMQTFDQSIFRLYEKGSSPRGGAALGVERRRVQARMAGHLDDGRHGARRDGPVGPADDHQSHPIKSTGVADAYVTGLRLLARRELSEAQVRTRLARRRVRIRTRSTRRSRACTRNARSTTAARRSPAPGPRRS